MKVLFVLGSIGNFNAFEDVIRRLCRASHDVRILYGETKSETKKTYMTDRTLRALQTEMENCESGPLLLRRKWSRLLNISRRLLSRTPYLHPQHPSPWFVNYNKDFSQRIQTVLDTAPVKALLRSTWFQWCLRKVEVLIPPDGAILRWVEENRPDVVVASPCMYLVQHEAEYLKAANVLGIPTIMALFSWDHLMVKGTFNIIPEWVFLWNQVLRADAVRFHGMPRDKIFLTGTPHFDTWFDMQPSLNRVEFCRRVGLDPSKPFVAYLCSSLFSNEVKFFKEFVKAISKDPTTHDLNVLVRPYPSRAKMWENFEDERVVVWPKDATIPDAPEAKHDYFHTFYHSIAVAGISSTAFLEAAVVDKPCLTIMTDTHRFEQSFGHFNYLLEADFLEKAFSLPEAASILAAILDGADAKEGNRHRFVRDFIRPLGLDKPASLVMAKAIETVARKQPLHLDGFPFEE